jgi:centromeric protein E
MEETTAAEKVHVYVRIRPLLRHEVESQERTAWAAPAPDTLVCLATEPHAAYAYNRVFGEANSSDDVYDASAKRLVQGAMQGFNGTLFAYGQTGSGKWMSTPLQTPQQQQQQQQCVAHTRP